MSQKATLLKVTSIIMIVFAAIALVMGCLSLSLVGAAAAGVEGAGILLMIGGVLVIISCGFQIFAGVMGIRAAKGAGSVQTAFVLGIIILALAVIDLINAIVGNSMSWTTIVGLVLPALYFIGAYQLKNEPAATTPVVPQAYAPSDTQGPDIR